MSKPRPRPSHAVHLERLNVHLERLKVHAHTRARARGWVGDWDGTGRLCTPVCRMCDEIPRALAQKIRTSATPARTSAIPTARPGDTWCSLNPTQPYSSM